MLLPMPVLKRIVYLLLPMVVWAAAAHGQRADAYKALQQAAAIKNETPDKAFLTLKGGSLLGRVNPDSALLIMHQALEMSRRISADSLTAVCIYAIADYNMKIGNLKVAANYCDTLLLHAGKTKSTHAAAMGYVTSGIIHAQQGYMITSMEEFHKALALQEQRKDSIAAAMTLVCLGNVYFQDEQKEQAAYYYRKAVGVQEEIDSLGAASTMVNLASVYIQMHQPDSGLYYNNLARDIVMNFDNGEELLFENYLNDVLLQMDKNNLAAADASLDKALAIANKQGAIFKLARALQTSATLADKKGNVPQAISQMKEAVGYFEQIGHLPLLKTAYRGMYELYDKSNNTTGALEMLKKYKSVSDSLYNDQVTARINDLNIRYETEKKEKSLEEKEEAIRRKNDELQMLYAVVVVALVIVLLVVAIYVQSKRAQKQRAIAERQERDIALLKALMTGEEKERTRIARELHDGLGGILAASQMQLSNIAEATIAQTPEIQKAGSLVSRAAEEARRIAHNLLPETLMRAGLDSALREYCLSINESKLVDIEYESLGIEQRMAASTELAIYRVVQELVNNIIKHAKATQAFIQLHRHHNTLSITIEDNGAGFDDSAPKKEGIGLANIKSRINYLNGSINIKSDRQKGTSVYIEIMLQKE